MADLSACTSFSFSESSRQCVLSAFSQGNDDDGDDDDDDDDVDDDDDIYIMLKCVCY